MKANMLSGFAENQKPHFINVITNSSFYLLVLENKTHNETLSNSSVPLSSMYSLKRFSAKVKNVFIHRISQEAKECNISKGTSGSF